MLKDLWHARVLPYSGDGVGSFGRQRRIGIGIHCVFHYVVAILLAVGRLGRDVELSHGGYECLCTVDDILVDSVSVERKFVDAVTVLVYDFHLLDNGRLAALARACLDCVSQMVRPRVQRRGRIVQRPEVV